MSANIRRVPDIMRHMSNLIVRADKEVILATNYWQNSVASKYITNAMRELSRRAGQRGVRIVFKMEYDRGSPKQMLENHYLVSEKERLSKAVNLPAPEDIPNIDLEVMNYHRPMVGTFHCKYMVVDRKYAVLQSNNIQDNDNMEMMTHLEGPIVDSLYDMALISWNKKLQPSLPSHNSPAVQGGLGAHQVAGQAGQDRMIKQPGMLSSQSPGPVQTSSEDILTSGSSFQPASQPLPHQTGTHESGTGLQNEDLGHMGRINENARAAAVAGDIEHIQHTKNTGSRPISQGTGQPSGGPDAKTRVFLGAGDQSISQSQIEQPKSLPEHTTDDPHYDNNMGDEVVRVQAAVSPRTGETRVEAVARHLNHTKNVGFKANAPECQPHEEMTPYIAHPAQEPFPIAMVCREPYGTPNHNSVYNPQNEVWLSALRNAKKNVFIQSPTLNAEPLVPAIIEACERGIDVYCYICLGYNDTVWLAS